VQTGSKVEWRELDRSAGRWIAEFAARTGLGVAPYEFIPRVRILTLSSHMAFGGLPEGRFLTCDTGYVCVDCDGAQS
jgi:hypothetical protein